MFNYFNEIIQHYCNAKETKANTKFYTSKINNKKKMLEKEEHILDAVQWRVEAEAIIDDVRYHVLDIKVCDDSMLPCNNQSIYLNLTTLEAFKFCIQLSSEGFHIVSNKHNCISNSSGEEDTKSKYFESIYSLLNFVSPQYRNSFGKSLLERLKKISESQKQISEGENQ